MNNEVTRQHWKFISNNDKSDIVAFAMLATEELINASNGNVLSDHVAHRLSNGRDHLDVSNVLRCLRTFNQVIEYNYNHIAQDRRILIRDANGVAVVLSVKDLVVVTAYYNDPSDNHNTLRESEYTRSFSVSDFLYGNANGIEDAAQESLLNRLAEYKVDNADIIEIIVKMTDSFNK